MYRGYSLFISLCSIAVMVCATDRIYADTMLLHVRSDEPLARIDGSLGSTTLSWQPAPCAVPQQCFVAFLDATSAVAGRHQSDVPTASVLLSDHTMEPASGGGGSGGVGGDTSYAGSAIPTSSDLLTIVSTTSYAGIATTTGTFAVSTSTPQTDAVYAPPVAKVKAPQVFTKQLHKGMRGSHVHLLQQILIEQGFLKIKKPTGYYGSKTVLAVKKFQRAHELETVGSVGPRTRAILNNLINGGSV